MNTDANDTTTKSNTPLSGAVTVAERKVADAIGLQSLRLNELVDVASRELVGVRSERREQVASSIIESMIKKRYFVDTYGHSGIYNLDQQKLV